MERIISRKACVNLTGTLTNLDESIRSVAKMKETAKDPQPNTKKSISIQDLQSSSQKSTRMQNLQVKQKKNNNVKII